MLTSISRALLIACALLLVPVVQGQPVGVGDCDSAVFVCSDTLLSGPSITAGVVNDLQNNFGCLYSGERTGAWIRFAIATDGLLGVLVSPDMDFTDLDLALWGPTNAFNCPQQAEPVRCSFAARLSQLSGTIGLLPGALDSSEVANGDGHVALLPVNTGELYTLFVDDFSMSGGGIGISWLLFQGASLSCVQPIVTGVPSVVHRQDASIQMTPFGILATVPEGGFEAMLIDVLGRQVSHLQAHQSGLLPTEGLPAGRYAVLLRRQGAIADQVTSVMLP